MHSVVEMAHLDDVEHTIQLLTAFAESVKAKDEFRVKL
jgi:putative aminopeptidase FrvX